MTDPRTVNISLELNVSSLPPMVFH